MVSDFVDNLINSKKVVVFSKTGCPFCTKAKQDERQDGNQIQDYMIQLTGARTVPRVFIGGEFVGGGDDVVEANKSGNLALKLKKVGAIG